VLLVWQERDRNEWATMIRQTLTAAGPFSLADPAVTEGILSAAGFAEVSFTEVHEPVYYGPDSDTAFEAVLRLQPFKDLDAAAAEQAHARLRTTLDAHHTDGGVYFDSRAWVVTARRRP
jgi:hypothetical protein